jgi:hypothetical protein
MSDVPPSERTAIDPTLKALVDDLNEHNRAVREELRVLGSRVVIANQNVLPAEAQALGTGYKNTYSLHSTSYGLQWTLEVLGINGSVTVGLFLAGRPAWGVELPILPNWRIT